MLYKKRKRKLQRYTKEFCDIVRRELHGVITTAEYPKIRFYRAGAYTDPAPELENAETTAGGDPIIPGYYDRSTDTIYIFRITKERPADLRQTIRHECLHFLLYKSGLPAGDKDKEFLALAYHYNANPYEAYAAALALIENQEAEQ